MKRPIRKIRLGIVGCGAIGSLVARYLDKKIPAYRVVALFDTYPPNAASLAKALSSKPHLCRDIQELVRRSDLILEAASVKAAFPIAQTALGHGRPMVMMSTGAYLLHGRELETLARKRQVKLYVPSGAVCGMDGIRAGRVLGKIDRIQITSRKNPRGFQGAPGLSPNQQKALPKTHVPKVLYQGDVYGAIKAFPANVNVAATTAMASGKPKSIKVKVIADPSINTNQHEIVVEGSFGRMTMRTENIPSKANPKTSALAIQAALALLERLVSPVEIGS